MGVIRDNRTNIVAGGLISASYVSDVYNVLTGNTVENIAFSGSVNITGSLIADLIGTASYADAAATASYSIVTTNVVTSSSFAESATSASYATTASYALNANSSEWTYSELIVSQSQIETLASAPAIILIPSASGKFTLIRNILIESNVGEAAYSGFAKLTISHGGIGQSTGTKALSGLDYVSEYKSTNTEKVSNSNVTLSTDTDPVSGSGSILVKMWYQYITRGSAL
jgi:hypothetical protein